MTKIDWDRVEIVAVFRATCPHCFSERYTPIRGWRSSDGSRTSRRVCLDCTRPFVVISEPLPESGKLENEIDKLHASTTKGDFSDQIYQRR